MFSLPKKSLPPDGKGKDFLEELDPGSARGGVFMPGMPSEAVAPAEKISSKIIADDEALDPGEERI